MKLTPTLLAAAIGFGAFGASGCIIRPRPGVYAQTSGTVVYQAPPARRVVVNRPAQPYAGAIWVDGHYQWNGAQYVWVQGYWQQPRAGYTYVQPTWVRQGNGYVYRQGTWRQGGASVRVTTPRRTVYRQPARRTTVVRTAGPARRTTVVRTQRPGRVRTTTTVRRGPTRTRQTTVRTRRGSTTRTTTVRRGGGRRGATVRVR